MPPLISIILPVYNAEPYLRQSIDSIIDQTFPDFELIIINDGSTDKSLNIINSYNDSRIKVVSRSNKGLIDTLNEGISIARGKYIARQDADDYSAPNRLEKQLYYLENNNNIDIVGSFATVIDENDQRIRTLFAPRTHEQIISFLPLGTTFIHGSVLFRNSGISYDKNYKHAEDYELWTRILSKGQGANIAENLYFYRDHGNNISHQYAKIQSQTAAKIQDNIWRDMFSPSNKTNSISFINFLKDEYIIDLEEKKFYSEYAESFAWKLFSYGLSEKAAREFRYAHQLYPRRINSWLKLLIKFLKHPRNNKHLV